MSQISIYIRYEDLKESAQKKLCEAYAVNDPAQAILDIVPLRLTPDYEIGHLEESELAKEFFY